MDFSKFGFVNGDLEERYTDMMDSIKDTIMDKLNDACVNVMERGENPQSDNEDNLE